MFQQTQESILYSVYHWCAMVPTNICRNNVTNFTKQIVCSKINIIDVIQWQPCHVRQHTIDQQNSTEISTARLIKQLNSNAQVSCMLKSHACFSLFCKQNSSLENN